MASLLRPLPFALLTLLFGTGVTCLGPIPPTPAGDWTGECALSSPVGFTLTDLFLVAEGEDILLEATGLWSLYQGTATWGADTGPVDLAQCTDDGGCTLQGTLYRPDTVIVLFYTGTEPAMLGDFEGETMSGDCFDGNASGTFSASRPER